MRVRELVDRLSEYSPEAEVRLMHQPHAPVVTVIFGVAGESEIREREGGDLGDAAEIVYVLAGHQLSGGRAIAWEVSD